MRRLTYLVASSLDGFIADTNGSFEAFLQQGPHLDWLVHHAPETLPGPALAAMGLTIEEPRFDTVLMGWNTYAVAHDQGLVSPYPHLRQIVFSRRHEGSGEVEVVSEDPVEVVNRLREQPGRDLWLCGGGHLAGQLVDAIDRVVLKVNPLVLGQGIPLFAAAPQGVRAFTHVAATHFDNGVSVLELERMR